jgi:hypothetical protein
LTHHYHPFRFGTRPESLFIFITHILLSVKYDKLTLCYFLPQSSHLIEQIVCPHQGRSGVYRAPP